MRRVVFPKRAVPPSIAHAIRDADAQPDSEADSYPDAVATATSEGHDHRANTAGSADQKAKADGNRGGAQSATAAAAHTAAEVASKASAEAAAEAANGWDEVRPGEYVVVCVTAASAQTLRGVPIAKASIAEFHQVCMRCVRARGGVCARVSCVLQICENPRARVYMS
jgi:hypothetical protein